VSNPDVVALNLHCSNNICPK